VLEFLSQTKIADLRDGLRQGWWDLWILTYQAKQIRCVWDKTAYSGTHRSCVKVFRSKFKASGLWGGGAPQNFWFDENPGKICENLGKMCENLRKIVLCALILQKWRPKSKCRRFHVFWRSCFFSSFSDKLREIWEVWGKFGQKWCLKCFDLKKCAQNGMKCSHFLRSFSLEFFSGKFGEIRRNPSHPQKFACSYAYV